MTCQVCSHHLQQLLLITMETFGQQMVRRDLFSRLRQQNTQQQFIKHYRNMKTVITQMLLKIGITY